MGFRQGVDVTTASILEEIFQDVKDKKRSMGRTIKFNVEKDKGLVSSMKKVFKKEDYKPSSVDKEIYYEGMNRYVEMTMSEETFMHMMAVIDKHADIITTKERQTIYDKAVRHPHFEGISKKIIKEIENEERLMIGVN